jgi:hypothetical protein
MCFRSTVLLPSLLLVLFAAEVRDTKAIARQTLQSSHQSASATQLADATVHTFHRGSGRRQFLWESTRSDV